MGVSICHSPSPPPPDKGSENYFPLSSCSASIIFDFLILQQMVFSRFSRKVFPPTQIAGRAVLGTAGGPGCTATGNIRDPRTFSSTVCGCTVYSAQCTVCGCTVLSCFMTLAVAPVALLQWPPLGRILWSPLRLTRTSPISISFAHPTVHCKSMFLVCAFLQ